MTPIGTSERLEQLRQIMRQHNLSAYYIPSEDAHQVYCHYIFKHINPTIIDRVNI